MMCSARELEIGEGHEGIIELPEDALVGTAYPDYAGLNDPVIDVSITPNRRDCLRMRRIALDLAAAGLGTLRPLAQVFRRDAIPPPAVTCPTPPTRTPYPPDTPLPSPQPWTG